MAPCRSSANASSARLNAEAAAYKRSQGAAGARYAAQAASIKRKHRKSITNAGSLRYEAQAASLRHSKHTGGVRASLRGFGDVGGAKRTACGV